jgi:hypothetical protein
MYLILIIVVIVVVVWGALVCVAYRAWQLGCPYPLYGVAVISFTAAWSFFAGSEMLFDEPQAVFSRGNYTSLFAVGVGLGSILGLLLSQIYGYSSEDAKIIRSLDAKYSVLVGLKKDLENCLAVKVKEVKAADESQISEIMQLVRGVIAHYDDIFSSVSGRYDNDVNCLNKPALHQAYNLRLKDFMEECEISKAEFLEELRPYGWQ